MDTKRMKWLLVLVILMWGSNFVFTKMLLETFSLWSLLFFRNFFAVLTLLVIVRKFINIKPKDYRTWGYVLGVSIIGVTINNIFFQLGLKYTLVTNASLIMGLTPLATAFISFLVFQTQLHWKQMLGVCFGFFGVSLVVLKGSITTLLDLSFNLGDLYMLGALLSFTIGFIFIKKATDNQFPSALITLYAYAIASLTYLPIMFWEQFVSDWNGIATDFLSWLMLLYVGIFPTGVGNLIWNKGISILGPGPCSIFMNGIPVVASLTALLILKEPLLIIQIFGFMFIATGIVMGSHTPAKSVKEKKEDVAI